MKNKRNIVMAAGLAALTLVGGSFTAYAAESEAPSKTSYSYTTGQIMGAQYADDATEEADKTDFSFNAGRRNAQSRNDVYTALPEGGTKEEAQAFYEQNDIGGGAWVNGAYDESAKIDYGYIKGQQRGSAYARDTGGEAAPDKSGYSYSTAGLSYEEKHESWRK